MKIVKFFFVDNIGIIMLKKRSEFWSTEYLFLSLFIRVRKKDVVRLDRYPAF